MATAYVLIQGENGDGRLAQRLREVPGVVSALGLSGPYDAIALARAGSGDLLLAGVVTRIRELPGVTHALPAPITDGSANMAWFEPTQQAATIDDAA